MNVNRIIALGAAFLMLAVGLGAFGAHGLQSRIGPEQLGTWRIAVEYHFYHALGLLLLAALEPRIGNRPIKWVVALLVSGILLFSGSLYLLSTKDLLGLEGALPVLGPITPLGGICFLAGWLVLFITASRQGDRR
ncbi:MAG: DUF423 domain-containing protein [Flavobacteriales bacterium]|nr:DUF423 domain-containing protein [Flavobacteriales bacterium]